jgi:hypothetical protein
MIGEPIAPMHYYGEPPITTTRTTSSRSPTCDLSIVEAKTTLPVGPALQILKYETA